MVVPAAASLLFPSRAGTGSSWDCSHMLFLLLLLLLLLLPPLLLLVLQQVCCS
jgi:hypothetical protein